MGEQKLASPDLGDPKVNANDIISWLDVQPEDSLAFRSQQLYEELLAGASRPRHSSVLACTRLCGFMQHCTRSRHASVRAWAFSEPTAATLFDFYIEWNEKDQHRSMRLVLDLLTVLVSQNPDPAAAASVRRQILVSLVSIISRRSTRPLVKSCIGSLNHLLGKGVYGLDDVARMYREVALDREEGEAEPRPVAEDGLPSSSKPCALLLDMGLWRRFCGDLVSWMSLHYVCSVAGKLLVTIFRSLRAEPALMQPEKGEDGGAGRNLFTIQTWLGWLEEELRARPAVLESIKLYVFVPLFKMDRPAFLELLERVNRPTAQSSHYVGVGGDFDSGDLLRLAALEVGKKSGLVEDPGSDRSGTHRPPSKAVVLDVQMMEGVLSHPSAGIRLLALSLLVTSPSSSKPYPSDALSLIRKHLPAYHADPGPGFRQEALAYCKIMVKRIKAIAGAGEKTAASTRPNNIKAAPEKNVSHVQQARAKSTSAAATKDTLPEETVAEHEAFLKWYLDFLLGELIPTASYQRHITGLKAAMQVLRFGREAASSAAIFLDESWIRSVLDLVVDPFSDVRETAVSLLMLAPPEAVEATVRGVKLIDIVQRFGARASALASRTGRADHGDGSARLQGLLCAWLASSLDRQLELLGRSVDEIERKLAIARSDIARAVMEAPVHGDFASIGCMWEVLTRTTYSDDHLARLIAVQRRLVPLCREIWDIVRPVLCDDSPEGHLPQDMEDAEGVDTKDLLSFSFRAIHESSNAMRLVVSPLRPGRAKGTLSPASDVFEAIGALTFEQLSNLRHRGAFSTVSLTFTTCCQLVGDPSVTPADSPAEESLLFAWYRGTLDCIFAQASTTRRSAGIPALMTGILAGTAGAVEDGAGSRTAVAGSATTRRPSFDEVMSELGEIAQRPARVSEMDGSNLPQVHALNCIKDVFKSSVLSSRAEPYLPTFLQVAANSLRSEVWAVRNCGLLLLRSVMDSLLGNGDSKALLESGWDGRTTRLSCVKYPALPTILLSLLEADDGKDGQDRTQQQHQTATAARDAESQRRTAESVFPALDIIRRAGPPDSHRDRLQACVAGYLASHLWHVREMAARTFSSFLVTTDWVAEIRGLLERWRTCANGLHGALLATKFLLEKGVDGLGGRLLERLPALETLLEEASDRFEILQSCPEIQAVLLETLGLVSSLSGVSGSVMTAPQLPDGKHQEPESSGLSGREVKPREAPPALLQVQLSLAAVQRAAAARDAAALRDSILAASMQDADAAAFMLESTPRIWSSLASSCSGTAEAAAETTPAGALCRVYVDVARRVADAGIRVPALLNLAGTLDRLLVRGGSREGGYGNAFDEATLLPSVDDLMSLWTTITKETGDGASPALLHAVIRVSGPLMAVLCLQRGRERETLLSVSKLDRTLRAWAATMSDAGHADNTFDTREAAALALRSFGSALGGRRRLNLSTTTHLPFLLAVYDALNDDDDEIRDLAAAAAAAAVLGSATGSGGPRRRLLNPIRAAEELLVVLSDAFAESPELQWDAVVRVAGQNPATQSPRPPPTNSPPQPKGPRTVAPARTQLRAALAAAADDSLFVVEEPNLFVDEVREARRWCGVLERCPPLAGGDDDGDNAPLAVLRAWVLAGLVALAEQAGRGCLDGPLGWTSAPGVFDVCARVVLAGVALARGHGDGPVAEALVAHREVFARAGMHGVILGMVDDGLAA